MPPSPNALQALLACLHEAVAVVRRDDGGWVSSNPACEALKQSTDLTHILEDSDGLARLSLCDGQPFERSVAGRRLELRLSPYNEKLALLVFHELGTDPVELAERYRRLLELSLDLVMIHQDGVIVEINAHGAALVGADDPQTLIGRRVLDFVPPELHEIVLQRIRNVNAGGLAPRNQERLVGLDGRILDVEAMAVPIIYNGRPAIQVVARDVSAYKSMAEALRKKNAELEELDRLKSQFVSMVSHELRTPLTSIMGYAEFLEDGVAGELGEGPREFVTLIQTATKRLQRLVDDLLDFSRMEAGTFRLNLQEVELGEAIRHVSEHLHPVSERRGVRIVLELPARPIRVQADPGRFEQVLANLIGNALKFTPSGGHVTVDVQPTPQEVTICVRDTGIGIPAQKLPHLFERFYQVDPSLTRTSGGAGLGLAIAKALVEAHGGCITVASEPNVGSAFCFTLPVARGDSASSSS
ncbi:MAG TPA: ATP-binding protein [Oscillatoriaceae cyanobacterium]